MVLHSLEIVEHRFGVGGRGTICNGYSQTRLLSEIEENVICSARLRILWTFVNIQNALVRWATL